VVLNDEDLAMELFYALQEGEISFPEVAYQYIQDKSLHVALGGISGMLHGAEARDFTAAVCSLPRLSNQ